MFKGSRADNNCWLLGMFFVLGMCILAMILVYIRYEGPRMLIGTGFVCCVVGAVIAAFLYRWFREERLYIKPWRSIDTRFRWSMIALVVVSVVLLVAVGYCAYVLFDWGIEYNQWEQAQVMESGADIKTSAPALIGTRTIQTTVASVSVRILLLLLGAGWLLKFRLNP